jgi:transposase
VSFRLREGHRVFVFAESIDFRAGFDKLSMLVREKMKKELVEGDLFLFLGRNRRRLKAICYDGTGLMLLSKRLERGRFMSVAEFEETELTVEELNYVLQGGIVRRKYFGERALQRSAEPLFSENGAGGSRTEYRGVAPIHAHAAEGGGKFIGRDRPPQGRL